MFGRRKTFMHPDAEAWQVDCWAWHIRHMGGPSTLPRRTLALPIQDHFPGDPSLGDEALAQHLFDRVRHMAGYGHHDIALSADTGALFDESGWALIQQDCPSAGMFVKDGARPTILYDAALIREPVTLIATLAHELGHYVNGQFPKLPPGGEDLVEPATDITAAAMGFAVFCANDAVNWHVHSDGIHTAQTGGKAGYLAEPEWCFALAMFCALSGADLAPALAHLKPHLARSSEKALAHIQAAALDKAVLDQARLAG